MTVQQVTEPYRLVWQTVMQTMTLEFHCHDIMYRATIVGTPQLNIWTYTIALVIPADGDAPEHSQNILTATETTEAKAKLAIDRWFEARENGDQDEDTARQIMEAGFKAILPTITPDDAA